MKVAFRNGFADLRERMKDSVSYTIIYAVAMYGSLSLFSSTDIPPGYDSVMHLSKIRIFAQFFPSIPRWFPWWYCGTPSLRFYPPLSYFTAASIGWLFQTSVLEAYQLTDFFSFFLAGFFIYLFMKIVTNSRFSSLSAAILYMLSPQTLYGRFFTGHFTHNFSMFFIPLTFFCIEKYGDSAKRTVLITAPLLALLFLSHYQTALSLGFMLGIYVLLSLIIGRRKKELGHTSKRMVGLFLGGALGASLASFWLLPSLTEGFAKFSLTKEAALEVLIPIESLFIEADNPWLKGYFLGLPLILLSFLATVLIAKRKITAEKMFWGIIFASWTGFFLFAAVSPYVGLVLGWPNRFPYFVSMSMSMLAGLALNWLEDHVLSSSGKKNSARRLISYLVLAIILLSPLIHTFDVERFAYKPYENELEASEWLSDQDLKPFERVASFGTFSYVFNVISDSWQLDGGYVQGQINSDFYHEYWLTLTGYDDINVILEILDETNTRYVVFPKGSIVPSAYQNETFFSQVDMNGFTIFRLKDNYALDFVKVASGNASVNCSYVNPDELHLTVRNCSGDATFVLKMNYYPGWIARSSQGEVELTKDPNSLMKIETRKAGSFDITLLYGPVLTDQIAVGVSIAGTGIYLFILLGEFSRRFQGRNHTGSKSLGTEYLKDQEKREAKENSEIGTTFEEPCNKATRELSSEAPKTDSNNAEKRQFFGSFHFASIIIVSIFALYIAWPYVSSIGIPGYVDAPGHAFKVWYLINCWSRYKVIPYLWDSWWYGGYPFLQVYSPLSYLIAASLGAVFFGGDPIAGFRWTIAVSNILSAIFMYFGVYMLFKSRTGGIVGGIVYASSAYRAAAVHTGMFPFYVASMFLPLTVPLYQHCLSSSTLRRLVLTATLLALILLIHVQLFVYAVFTLFLYSILKISIQLHRDKTSGLLGEFADSVKILVLIVLVALCFTSGWVIPFLTYRSFFYTQYPEFIREASSTASPWLFLQQSTCYLGVATLCLIILAFIVNKRTRRSPVMIFFLISGFLSGFLSVYQVVIFKGTIIEQMPLYGMITPGRWVFITFLSLAFLAGGATKFVCEIIDWSRFFSQRPNAKHISRAIVTSIIVCIIIFDAGRSAALFYNVPTIQQFPAAVTDLSNGDEYYRVCCEILGLSYVPAISNREILQGWYIEGAVLRDWLYNLEWIIDNGERENMIPPLLELFAVKYYVVEADNLDRIERFNKTGEFKISHSGDWCVMELKRDVQYLSVKKSILYLGNREDLINAAETLLFCGNSSILIPSWKEYADDYTVKELNEFDTVLLHRYNCQDQARMDEVLHEYVDNGGVVIIASFYANSILDMETYYAESQGEYKTTVNEKFEDTVFQNVNASRFSPALYAQQYPWKYVAFNVTSHNEETETLLTIDNNPVLAYSTVGKGKIAWIGFNFLEHIHQYLNRDEAKMIENLLLLSCGRTTSIEMIMFEKRAYGYVDALFSVDESSSFWLLVSESYYHGWRIYINQKPAKIYMAEPKLMVAKVEANISTPVQISLRYELTEPHVFGCAITALSILFLSAMLLLQRKHFHSLLSCIKVSDTWLWNQYLDVCSLLQVVAQVKIHSLCENSQTAP